MKANRWFLAIAASAAVMAGMPATLWAQNPPSRTDWQSVPHKPAAVVNGVPISVAEVEALLNRDGPSLVPLPESRHRQQRLNALESLIENQLIEQFLMR